MHDWTDFSVLPEDTGLFSLFDRKRNTHYLRIKSVSMDWVSTIIFSVFLACMKIFQFLFSRFLYYEIVPGF